jgi:hypothetical protein
MNRAAWLNLRARYRNARFADRAAEADRLYREATDPIPSRKVQWWPRRRYESAVVDGLAPRLRQFVTAMPATRDDIDPRSRNLRAVAAFHSERRYKADLLRQFYAQPRAVHFYPAPAATLEAA